MLLILFKCHSLKTKQGDGKEEEEGGEEVGFDSDGEKDHRFLNIDAMSEREEEGLEVMISLEPEGTELSETKILDTPLKYKLA